jgi:hypothetical protein
MEIESMLARGSDIGAIQPIMGQTFSRRASYGHQRKHMMAAGLPLVGPISFSHEEDPG